MNRPLRLTIAAAGAVLVAILVAVYLRLSVDINPDTGPKPKREGGVEKPLELARNILRKDADLSAIPGITVENWAS